MLTGLRGLDAERSLFAACSGPSFTKLFGVHAVDAENNYILPSLRSESISEVCNFQCLIGMVQQNYIFGSRG